MHAAQLLLASSLFSERQPLALPPLHLTLSNSPICSRIPSTSSQFSEHLFLSSLLAVSVHPSRESSLLVLHPPSPSLPLPPSPLFLLPPPISSSDEQLGTRPSAVEVKLFR